MVGNSVPKAIAKRSPGITEIRSVKKQLLCDSEGNCQVYDPKQGDKVIFSSNDYETAKLWLLEDEYEPLEGRLLAAELV